MSHDATAVSNRPAHLQAKLAHADPGSINYKLIVSRIKALGGNVPEGSSSAVIYFWLLN